MIRRLLALLALLLPLTVATPALAQSAGSCQFILGFATLHSLDPADVGNCVDNQAFAANGDAQQHTTKGLLVWRKRDNFTAFTDGARSWVNGPNGLLERLNTQRFSWEANPDGLPLADAIIQAQFAPIAVRQPQPDDLVDDPVEVAGVGTGFEGMITARVRDATGKELARVAVHVGGTGIWGNFQAGIPLGAVPVTPQGTLEVFELSPKGDGAEIHKVVVPITFGRALLDPYHGFAEYTVAPGDTLRGIAQRFYGDSGRWPTILEANRDRLADPDHLATGHALRIPQ